VISTELTTSGKVVYGPDFLGVAEFDLPESRQTGHGTFMAGPSRAGLDADRAVRGMAFSRNGAGCSVVSVKVGAADGGVDVSQVIAAIDWIVQHRTTTV
jgi:serine protease AprX